MALTDVSYFYEEPPQTSTRLFLTLSQGKEKITPNNLKQALKALKLTPSPKELYDIFVEVLQNSNCTEITERVFRQMRLSPPGSMQYQCVLNIIAEYVKFNCAYIHRSFITEDAIETALGREKASLEFIKQVQSQMLKLVFNEQYRILGVKELYCFMRGLVPNQWRQWICDCLSQGFAQDDVAAQMIQRGFDQLLVRDTIDQLKENGYVSALPQFLDTCPLNVTHLYV